MHPGHGSNLNVHRQMNGKEDVCIYVYTHTHTHMMEYYSAIKKNEIIPFAATWIDLDIIILTEVIQTEKGKYHIIT